MNTSPSTISPGVRVDNLPILPATTNARGGRGTESPAGATSLVSHGISQQITIEKPYIRCSDGDEEEEKCPDASWLKGVCRHGNSHWVEVSCKRRGCPVCGAKRRRKIAYRIALGVELLGGTAGAGWFVGTFDYDVGKKQAVKVQSKFVRWLRKETGVRLEYAVTWEETRKGRLHCNIVFAPWEYVPQKLLSEKWSRFGGGSVVWIERVGAGIGVEAAKSRQEVANYFAKFDQMVKSGRGVAYSKGWSKLPESPETTKRKGEITWQFRDRFWDDAINFADECRLGYWSEVRPGEWAWCLGDDCGCFELVSVDDS